MGEPGWLSRKKKGRGWPMQPAHALFDGFGDLIMASYRPGILRTEEACLCCTVECGFQNTSAW